MHLHWHDITELETVWHSSLHFNQLGTIVVSINLKVVQFFFLLDIFV